jgi:peptidoglycan/xylan/chitin deacetylase (PgdA/CDA1 family)
MLSFAQDLAAVPFGEACGLVRDRAFRSVLTVFVFHDVSDAPSAFSREHNLNVPPALFRRQLDFIGRNFNPIDPRELSSQAPLPDRPALVSFDDGLRGYFTTAVPLLAERGIPSVIFLNLAPVHGELFWSGLLSYLARRGDFKAYVKENVPPSALPLFLRCSRALVERFLATCDGDLASEVRNHVGAFATKDDLERAASNPLVSFGNHLFNHEVPALLSDAEFTASYTRNREALAAYPNHVDLFSFPFGRAGTVYGRRHVELARTLGARRAFSGVGLLNRDSGAFHLHRVSLTAASRTTDRMWFDISKLTLARAVGAFRLKDDAGL